jgi:type IV pilus assembly protein PilC
MLNRNEKMELFPADFIQMLSVWEKTATIDKVCVKINEQYTREVKTSLNNLTKWIEPLAILLAWIFVLWFAFAIFGAILSITDSVQ